MNLIYLKLYHREKPRSGALFNLVNDDCVFHTACGSQLGLHRELQEL